MINIFKAIGIAYLMTACTTGVSQNVEDDNASYAIAAQSSLGKSLMCFEKEAAKLPFRYDVEQQANKWYINFQIYGGAVTGWFDKGVVINNGRSISYYADAADLGLDAFGLKAAVVPVMDTCA